MKENKDILDATKMRFLSIHTPNYVVVDAYEIPELTPSHWFLLERIYAITVNCTNMYKESVGNTYEEDGLKYYWISSSLLLRHTKRFGIKSKQTISRIMKDWKEVKPEIIKTHIRGFGKGAKIFYAFTEFSTTKLFNTGNVDVSGIEQQKEEDDSTDDVFEEPTPEPAKPQFPDWFEEQWGILVKSKFPSARQYKSDGVTPNKYALDFAEAVQEIVDGTFYKGKGKTIKDKSIDIPEGLSVEDVIEAVLNVENKFITNPYSAILLVTKTVCFSPVLKWFDSGNKPAKKNTVVKHSIRSKVKYTEEQQNTVKPIKYLWDQVLKTDPETGRVMESMQGALSDGWIQRHGLFKKYDLRIANFYADIYEAYEGLSVRKPDIFKVLETLEDMAKYAVQKGTEQDWKDKFWEFVDTLPIYTDSPVWTWFVNRYEELFGGVICDMAKFKNSRNRAEIQSQMDGFKEFMEE
jgi:hypothetical protein